MSGTIFGPPFFFPVPEPEADAEEEEAAEDLPPGGAPAPCRTHKKASIRCKIKAMADCDGSRKFVVAPRVKSGRESAESWVNGYDIHTYIHTQIVPTYNDYPLSTLTHTYAC